MMDPGRAIASPPGDLYPLGNAGIHPEWGIALMRHPTVSVIHLGVTLLYQLRYI